MATCDCHAGHCNADASVAKRQRQAACTSDLTAKTCMQWKSSRQTAVDMLPYDCNIWKALSLTDDTVHAWLVHVVAHTQIHSNFDLGFLH